MNIQNQDIDITDVAFRKAAKLFIVLANAILFFYILGVVADFALQYIKHSLSFDHVKNMLLSGRTANLVISYLLYSFISNELKNQKKWAVYVGRAFSVLKILLGGFLIFLSFLHAPISYATTVLGVIVLLLGCWFLSRLFDQNIRNSL